MGIFITSYSSENAKCLGAMVVIFLSLVGLPTISQISNGPIGNRELGFPYMQHFEPSDYDGRPDNQALVKGDNGLMYIGNSKGVLEFDGVSWRLIQLPNHSLIKTLVKNDQGEIFVGGFNELGSLEPDSLGFLTFRSFMPHLDSAYHNFNYLRNSFTLGQDAYFQSNTHLFRWSKQAFKVWSFDNRIIHSSIVEGTIYLQEEKRGLFKLDRDGFQFICPVPFHIQDITAVDHQKLLIATAENGLFLLEHHELIPFPTPASAYLKQHNITQCMIMPNKWITIGTHSGGLVVLEKDGSLVHIIDKSSGLLNNSILAQELDDQRGLWLGLAHGISRIELISPYTIFDERLGVSGFVNAITRFQGRLYAATSEGSLLLTADDSQLTMGFKEIPGSGPSFYFQEIGSSLFLASRDGVFSFDQNQLKSISTRRSAALLQSKINPSILYVGLLDGLALMKKINGQWMDLGKIAGIEDDIRELVELEDGKLWMESQVDGVWLVDFYVQDSFNLVNPEIKRFQANKQLPAGWLFLHSIRGEAVFEINGTIYKYNASQDSIMPDPEFGVPFGFEGDIVPKLEDERGNLWISAQLPGSADEDKQRTIAIPKKDGGYLVKHIDDKRIMHSTKKALFPEETGILWYGGVDGIIRQDLNFDKPSVKNFSAFIRKISINQDSVVYGGIRTMTRAVSWQFGNKTLRFEYAAPSFDEITLNRYQYFLEGYDRSWSNWTEETRKDYTKIPEGNYTFRVRAKNVYRHISTEDFFTFTIMPPWYRSWWAYFLYSLIFIFFIAFIWRWRARQLKAENEALEKTVSERTEEVRHQSHQLKMQAEKLQELDRLKSRFFANISHEFRTPLTLILGPLKDRLNNALSPEDHAEIDMMHRNAERLQRLINQLLDLSQIESHCLKLKVGHGDIHFFLKAILSSFISHAQQRDIQYEILIPEKELMGYFDDDKLEKIIYNLVSNAFKFTPDGGEITISSQWKQGKIKIEVTDNGCGISSDKLGFIFDRFYQTDDSHTRQYEGSGIGLALTKELILLHKGTIDVKSIPDEGSTFTIVLPLDNSFYQDNEIMEMGPQPAPSQMNGDPNREYPQYPENVEVGTEAPVVLVVEDHRELRVYIKKYLSGYQVLEASDGAKGLEMAIKSVPDLIISDVMMPKMDGVSMLQAIKTNQQTSHIPVILLTAKADLPSKMEGLETGADDYLTKPFDAKELLTRCQNLIVQRKSLREKFINTLLLKPKNIEITSTDGLFLDTVMQIIEKHLDDSSFSVETFQREVGMSRMQLHRKLKALTDYSTTEFIRVQRLQRATQLLTDSDASISDICYRVGFNSLSYFTKCFKEQYGTTPSDYAYDHQT